MQKPALQTILISILIIVSLFVSIYFPYKWKQLSNDFLDQTNHYGELLKQINDLQKEVKESRDGEGDDLEDWKVYKNEEYGFEFKYQMDIDSLSDEKIADEKECGKKSLFRTTSVIDNDSQIFVHVGCANKTIFDNYSKNPKNETITINNYKAVKFNKGVGQYFQYGYSNSVQILGEEFQYKIEFYTTNGSKEYLKKTEPIFWDMVYSFRVFSTRTNL